MFWDNFVRLCNRVGKYPNAVAAEVGVKSTGTVTGWKNGAMPRQSVLKKLCDYFDVTEAELLGDATGQKESAITELIGDGATITENKKKAIEAILKMKDSKVESFLNFINGDEDAGK